MDHTPRQIPYHIDSFLAPSEMSSSSSSFDAQRAAAMRCELNEYKDTLASQTQTITKIKNIATNRKSEITRLKSEVKDITKTRDELLSLTTTNANDTDQMTSNLDATRKRFRNRVRTLKTKIDSQSSTIDSLRAKCTALDNARLKMERLACQSVTQHDSATSRLTVLEDHVSTLQLERDDLLHRNNNERSVSEELRQQVERAAVREAHLRETASTLAGFQQDLATACTTIRGTSSNLLTTQNNLKSKIREHTQLYSELENKHESYQLFVEESNRAASAQNRKLRRELNAVRKELNTNAAEHHKERDSHIKAQSVMRKSLEEGRKKMNVIKKTNTKLSFDLEKAVESRIDMELGLKSVRLKLDRTEESIKSMANDKNQMELQCDEKVLEIKNDNEKLNLALHSSKRKQTALEKNHNVMQTKFEQMKKMLQHLADANGQVARVYGALGSRLTEIRAEQAAARGSLEATRDNLLFMSSRIEDGITSEEGNRVVLIQKEGLLNERNLRLKGMVTEMKRITNDRDALRKKQEIKVNQMHLLDVQKTKDDKIIIRLNAELVQTRNTVRKTETNLLKTSGELTSMKNERVRLMSNKEKLYQQLIDAKEEIQNEKNKTDQHDNERRQSISDSTLAIERKSNEIQSLTSELHSLKALYQQSESQCHALQDEKMISIEKYTVEKEQLSSTINQKGREIDLYDMKMKEMTRMVDKLQKERMTLMEENQTRKDTYMKDLSKNQKVTEEWRSKAQSADQDIRRERERAEAMQKLATALRERTFETERRASISEERAKKEIELAERAARMARDDADAAQVRATRATNDLLMSNRMSNSRMSASSSSSSTRHGVEDYPLGFHLAIEQLVQVVRQKRSLFGKVVDSFEDAFRAMDSSGRGSLEEADLARALHRLDIEMSNTQLKDLLNHLDANNDGVVDAGEFLDAMRRHEESMQPTPSKGGNQMMMNVNDFTIGGSNTPIRSLRGSRNSNRSGGGSGGGGRRIEDLHRHELRGGGGGSLLSPSRNQRASYLGGSPSDEEGSSGKQPQWKR